jgi:ribosomal protein L24E
VPGESSQRGCILAVREPGTVQEMTRGKRSVCGMEIEEAAAATTRKVDGTTYYFCSQNCVEQAAPARTCPNCHKPAQADWRNCPYCGTALE